MNSKKVPPVLRSEWVESLAEWRGMEWVRPAHASWLRHSFHRLWGLRNLRARLGFRRQPPRLNAVQRGIVAAMRSRGVAAVPFAALWPEPELWNGLLAEARAWASTPEMHTREWEYRTIAVHRPHFKDHIVKRYERASTVVWDCPWLRLGLEPILLDIVNSYLDLYGRLNHVNLWNTIAHEHRGDAVGPQRWHRDPDDKKLIKVFLYFSDTDAASGALEYVLASRPGERHGRLWPQELPFDGGHPPEAALDAVVAESDRIICAHAAGTLVFVDTTGFHRGGRAIRQNRLLATWAYSTQASIRPRAFVLEPKPSPWPLTAAAAWALGLERAVA